MIRGMEVEGKDQYEVQTECKTGRRIFKARDMHRRNEDQDGS